MPEPKKNHIRLVSVMEGRSPVPRTRVVPCVPDLKLVTVAGDAKKVGGGNRLTQNSCLNLQYALSLDDPYTVILININRKDVHWFLDLLQSITPKLIIDARSVARLDVLCGTRANAFKVFKSRSVEYVDLFGQLGITTYQSDDAQPDHWCNKIGEVVPNISTIFGPVLVVFDKQDLLESSVEMIASEFRKLFKHEISLSVKSE
ncbi:MAG: hypothetical protein HQL75_06200 [Magnetococcales bacterium]|nr:hypothetical protein [Magnetococcales bacterium]